MVHFGIEQKDADPIHRSGTQLEGLRRVDPGLIEKIYTESVGKSIQWIETSRLPHEFDLIVYIQSNVCAYSLRLKICVNFALINRALSCKCGNRRPCKLLKNLVTELPVQD